MMPRLSVYVQDDLWDRARAAEPELNPSQVVQAALRRLVPEETDKPPFARVRPTIEHAEFEEIERNLAEQARKRYELGFERGIKLSKKLEWRHLDQLGGCKWNIRQWLEEQEEGYANRFRENPPLFAILNLDEEVVDEITDELLPWYERETAFRQGMVDALQTVWDAVMKGQPALNSKDEEAGGAVTGKQFIVRA